MQFFIHDAIAAETKTVDTTATEQAQVPEDLSADKMIKDNLLILGLLFFIFYFMLIRPQQKRVKQHNDLMKGLQKGNKVITSGGMYGVITKLEGDDIVVVEIAPSVKVRISRSAVAEVVDKAGTGDIANDN